MQEETFLSGSKQKVKRSNEGIVSPDGEGILRWSSLFFFKDQLSIACFCNIMSMEYPRS